jgi:lipopolysaccharide/colanic/teichoic acid biosynthesis glycosyltransferase
MIASSAGQSPSSPPADQLSDVDKTSQDNLAPTATDIISLTDMVAPVVTDAQSILESPAAVAAIPGLATASLASDDSAAGIAFTRAAGNGDSGIAPALAESILRDVPARRGPRTIWGQDPVNLHTRYWASYGVQVVRQGEPSQIIRSAELFLLIDPRSLVTFRLSDVIEVLNWINPQVLFLRLHDTRERGYREKIVTDANDQFVRCQRLYDASEDLRLARVVLTSDREVAQLWQSAPDPLSGWRRLRRFTPRHDRSTRSVEGHVYDRSMDREVAYYLRELMLIWHRPDTTVERAKAHDLDVWKDSAANVEPGAKFIGPVWVGAGRTVSAGSTVIGPAIVWDSPEARPQSSDIQWLMIEPREIPEDPSVRVNTPLDRALKRLFDLAFALFALTITAPLYPIICLSIWLEDGRPFFFAHRRQTLGGREFPCIKFRSMRKDAEKMKAQLRQQNQADGPQFFMEKDPRLTRVGRVVRKYNLDELPQFLNVLAGHMSIVGPRPSPHSENQFCPAWREARLSVRPGITGLWQISRTRRSGSDFQEWIKYDIEYVEKRTWKLDMLIIWKTVSQILRKASRS